ncbi:RAMP superfamily CRISPR-associated protein [Vibrio metoecus]|uniref:RAMP superfamily CRISPR-associated protein n=1 Tax=Vibrio metoecus TaxID=1481663 RepID=UPI00138EE117|nr:RAMP superfamily CRISPR-associated protein [Vibrio metoecus]
MIIGGARANESETNENGSGKECIKFFKTHPNGRLDKPERLAIPANSLRGAVASVAEAISDSAMRVLADERYSVRTAADSNEVFSQIGIVVDGENGLELKPLTIGGLKQEGHGFPNDSKDSSGDWVFDDAAYFMDCEDWKEVLPVSLEFYHQVPNSESYNYPHIKERSDHQLARYREDLECFHGGQTDPKFVYIRDELPDASWDDPLPVRFPSLNIMFKTLKGLKMGTEDGPEILYMTDSEFQKHLAAKGKGFEENDYRRYVFFHKGNIKNLAARMVATKKHELLIPYSKRAAKVFESFPIPDDVKEAFESKLRQHPKDVMIPDSWITLKGEENVLKICAGDLLYFKGRSTEDGESYEITELSLSQIWRSEVTHQSLHGIMAASGHSRYLPWGSQKRKAKESKLTAAEILFGVVEDRETDKSNADEGKALATRVRFYDAISLKESLEAFETTLTLDSPKPPSPSLYLRKNDGSGVSKADLTDNASFQINGRKRYLQHQNAAVEMKQTGTDEMLTKAECITASTEPTFGFWIEFDNLTEEELSLLLLSTGAKQTEAKQTGNVQSFYHQLGMGKPYGFGKCEMNVLAVLLKDPEQRYNSLSSVPVYQQQLQGYTPSETNIGTLEKLAECVEHPALTQFLKAPQLASRPYELNHAQNPLISQVALKQIAALANENNFTEHKIHYPMPSPQTADTKIFEWFARNEKQRSGSYQYLGKLADNGKVTPLKKI